VKSVSIVIPTLNSARILEKCLKSVRNQDYKADVEIVIADGGSSDQTLEIAKGFKAKIFENKLRTGEAGKAVGIKAAKEDLIVLLDSDNVLPDQDWLKNLTFPFSDKDIVGSEPWKFEVNRKDGLIDRYSGLMGMNDPMCYWLGNYDHWNYIDEKWTRMKINAEDKGSWLKLKLDSPEIPTIGANGAVFQREFLWKHFQGEYFFDIDFLPLVLSKNQPIYYAKVKTSIHHLFCGSDFKQFYRKQHRRIRDMLARRNVTKIFFIPDYNQRQYRWGGKSKFRFTIKIGEFILNCLTVVPLFIQLIKGYQNKKSKAWLIHPLMCWLTLAAYGQGTIESLFAAEELDRKKWKQ